MAQNIHEELHALFALKIKGRPIDESRMETLQGLANLILQTSKGDVVAVAHALDAGLDIGVRDMSGATLLCIAANNGKADCVELLLARGLDPHQARHDGFTPLMGAAFSGSAACARLLIPVSDLEARTHARRLNPLFHAAASGHAEIVHMLLAAGARPDARMSDGATPLMLAARESASLPTVQALLPVSDLSARDTRRRVARDLVPENSDDGIAAFLDAYILARSEMAILGGASAPAQADTPSRRAAL